MAKSTSLYQFSLSPFIASEKTVFVVDCENSDPYALCAAINNLDSDRLEKIEKIILEINPYAFKKIERNELCPCGSGKKYKKCHGK